MTRHPDWYARLMDYGLAAMLTRFAYGRHDCALFAAGAVAAMTGTDPAAPYRGRYTTRRGGLRVLRQAGYRDQIEMAAAHLPEIAPAFAQAGDLAVVEGDDGPALGVVTGETIWVLRPDGLGRVPLLYATRAFRA